MNRSYWHAEPAPHDYEAAFDYLTLHFAQEEVQHLVNRLKKENLIIRKAKDLLRASGLPLLPKDNIHVREKLHKVKRQEKLSPVLLVRGFPLIIADGYHRVCAICYLSEDREIPCKLADRA